MEIWQIVLLGYFGFLVAWLIFNAILLLISMIAKRKVFVVVEGLTAILATLFGAATGIGDIAFVVWLFSIGQVFWAIVAIVLGIGLVSFIGQLLAIPFIAIVAGFSGWYDSMEEKE